MDHLRITVKGGTGGSGLGDYGGVGGEGGDVYLIADKKQSMVRLSRDYPRLSFIARVGNHSRKLCLLGEKGKDLLIPVPIGITVQTDDGKVIGMLLIIIIDI